MTVMTTTLTTLILGRAVFLSIERQQGDSLHLINIYAPNAASQHPTFWTEVTEKWSAYNLLHPHLMMGDFNLVEDPLDRAPARLDSIPAITVLCTCRQSLGLQDVWRHSFPSDHSFSYSSPHNMLLRLDQIYTQPELNRLLTDWTTTSSKIPSDHHMVLVRYAPPNTPFIGSGRWSWPLGLLHDKQLNETITRPGREMHDDLKTLSPEDRSRNAQTLWQRFKDNVKKEASSAAKLQISKISKHLIALRKDVSETSNNAQLDTDESLRSNIISLEREIDHLEKKRYRSAYNRLQALWQVKGEQINKYWSKINNPNPLCDLIHHLIHPTTNTPVTRSNKMAELTRDYHENLQKEGLSPPESEPRHTVIQTALDTIPDQQKLADPTDSPLNSLIDKASLETALYSSKLGSATGPDGLPYELWRHLKSEHKRATEARKPSFDIMGCMLTVLNNIQKHGVDERTNFTLSWMCLIYKKKERDQIKNYHPITLLNTDYKLLMKTLSIQLASHIRSLIHQDQTGFIPKCSIFNPIRLSQTLCAYTDYMEEDSAIIALDQEKAYNKIDHHYLVRTLIKFNLLVKFINTVQSLYQNAETSVIINGVVSNPF